MPRKPRPPRRRVRGSGSLIQLADGTIRARLPASIDPRRTAREFRPGQRAQAEAWLAEQLNPQPAPATTSITLEQWAATWWTDYVAAIRPLNTARKYRWALAELAPLDAMQLSDVRQTHLQGVVGLLAARVSPDTLAAAVGVWRRCLEDAVEDGLIGRNPARRLTLPKAPRRPPARHLTAAEVATLRPAIVGHRFEAAFALMLGCGLRIGEILGLHWQDVDLTAGRARIGPQYTNGHWRPHPKSRVIRWIELPAAVVRSLIRHKQTQPEGATLVMESPHRGQRRKQPDGTRRPRPTEPRPWTRSAVADALTALLAELGIAHATPHAGRRGLATALLNDGIPLADVAEMLGHASPEITLHSYSMSSGNASAVRRAVDEYLGNDTSGVNEVG